MPTPISAEGLPLLSALPLHDVAPNIKRLVLPMGRFVSVNAWIIGAAGHQALVDTGSCDQATAAIWEQAEVDGLVAGVEAIMCTHMHRDHTGQLPALMRRHGAPLHMTMKEHQDLAAQCSTPREQNVAEMQLYLERLGLDKASAARIEPVDYTMLAPLPTAFEPLLDGMSLTLGGMQWRVRFGGGHSRQAALLMADDQSLILAGDQILGGSGPLITTRLDEMDGDPLADYLAFLDSLHTLPDTMLVLPGHDAPFYGIAQHGAALRRGHEKRLARVMSGMNGAMSCMQMVPGVFSARTAKNVGDLLPGMVAALANHLWHAGRLRRHCDDDGVFRFEVAI